MTIRALDHLQETTNASYGTVQTMVAQPVFLVAGYAIFFFPVRELTKYQYATMVALCVKGLR
jgi:hypothetical protein